MTCDSTATADYFPPSKRVRARSDDFGFQVEHVERLRFIRRALAYGFTVEDITALVDERGLVTCNDVYRISLRRLEELRHSGSAKAAALERLIASCSGKGGPKDCEILAALGRDRSKGPRSKLGHNYR